MLFQKRQELSDMVRKAPLSAYLLPPQRVRKLIPFECFDIKILYSYHLFEVVLVIKSGRFVESSVRYR